MRNLFLAAVVLVAGWARADFTGTYEANDGGQTLTLELKQEGNKLTGKANAHGTDLVLDGTVKGDTAKGKLTVSGVPVTLYFEAKLVADGVSVKIGESADKMDDEAMVFKRVEAKATEAKPGETATFSKEKSEILKSGKEYTHASGGKFRYPADWQVKEGEGFLMLVPPDQKEGELFLIAADSAEGATDPGSPEVLAYLDSQIAQAAPDAKRSGKAQPAVAGAGKAVVQDWTGTIQGRASLIRGYITIIKDKGVALVAVGTKEQIDARDPVLRQIFQTVGWGQGKVDQQLVGTWNHWGYSGTSDGKYGREEKVRVELRADGSFAYQNDSETSISASGANQYGDTTWAGGMAGRRGNGWNGTWSADGSTIILNFEDGTSESFKYRFEQQGANVFLVTEPADGGKGKMEWSRAG
ncbi:MAG: lipocalin family protein [Armatimonadetes bacterium]|nr:lipocalin family protein [Armatimonadota bacterium]